MDNHPSRKMSSFYVANLVVLFTDNFMVLSHLYSIFKLQKNINKNFIYGPSVINYYHSYSFMMLIIFLA